MSLLLKERSEKMKELLLDKLKNVPMSKEDIIEQLESLWSNSVSFLPYNGEIDEDTNIWAKDIVCLNLVIDFIEKNYPED